MSDFVQDRASRDGCTSCKMGRAGRRGGGCAWAGRQVARRVRRRAWASRQVGRRAGSEGVGMQGGEGQFWKRGGTRLRLPRSARVVLSLTTTRPP